MKPIALGVVPVVLLGAVWIVTDRRSDETRVPPIAQVSAAADNDAPSRATIPVTLTKSQSMAAEKIFFAASLVTDFERTGAARDNFQITDSAVWIAADGSTIGAVVTARRGTHFDVPAGVPNIRETDDNPQGWMIEAQPTTVEGAVGITAYVDLSDAAVVAVAPIADGTTVFPSDPATYVPDDSND